MLHNGHVIQLRHMQALLARAEKHWLSYEFYRQWHEDELRNAGLIP